jgi:2-polyprenyl-6-methoxyphenol hydroxylase-like FAD-dependent oxidoreductase
VPHRGGIASQTKARASRYPMNDTWKAVRWRRGLALIGDAARRSDPNFGQGISVAARDARM